MLLAGAAAEQLMLGSRSTGVCGDFQEAIKLARRYVLSGMSPLGLVDEEIVNNQAFYDAEQALLRGIEQQVVDYISASISVLEQVLEVLMREERIEGELLRQVLSAV